MRGARHHAGMTFMEVVVGVALLSVVTAALFGLFSFITGMQLRQQQTLACAEVANRLILQYLDEPTKMPDEHKPIEYGPAGKPARFRYEYKEEPIQLIEVLPEQRDQSRTSPLSTERFRQVTVRVWLGEESGGTRYPEPNTPLITLTRLVDPMYPRNPDSFMNMLNDPEAFKKFMETMMGFQGTTSIRGGTTTSNPQSGQRQGRPQLGPGGVNARGAFQQGGQRGGNRLNLGRFNLGNGNARPAGNQGGVRPIGGAPAGGPR
jgi:type II secretory pathway pseudopilin PulG